jgi:dCTP deaminase
VARLVYEPLTARPARIYGQDGSHYQRQGLKLSKHFRAW